VADRHARDVLNVDLDLTPKPCARHHEHRATPPSDDLDLQNVATNNRCSQLERLRRACKGQDCEQHACHFPWPNGQRVSGE